MGCALAARSPDGYAEPQAGRSCHICNRTPAAQRGEVLRLARLRVTQPRVRFSFFGSPDYIAKRPELAGQLGKAELAHIRSGGPVGPNLRGDALDLVFKGRIEEMKHFGMLPQSIQTSRLRPTTSQPDVFVGAAGSVWSRGTPWLDVTTSSASTVKRHYDTYGPNGTVWTWTWWAHGKTIPGGL
jgi:hypothetical protein